MPHVVQKLLHLIDSIIEQCRATKPPLGKPPTETPETPETRETPAEPAIKPGRELFDHDRYDLRPMRGYVRLPLPDTSPFRVPFPLHNDIPGVHHDGPLSVAEHRRLETSLYNVLNPVLNSQDDSWPNPGEVTFAIDRLCWTVGSMEGYLWSTWNYLFNVVERIPLEDSRMELMVDIFRRLKTSFAFEVEARGLRDIFKEPMPILGPFSRHRWVDTHPQCPIVDARWICFNSFCARLLTAEICSWTSFALWQLRDSLERDPPTLRALESRATTASEWIMHAGEKLYKLSVDMDSATLTRAQAIRFRPGPLFCGRPGFGSQRWIFWREKMVAFREAAGSMEVAHRVHEAIGVMRRLERPFDFVEDEVVVFGEEM